MNRRVHGYGFVLRVLTPTLPWQGCVLGRHFDSPAAFAWFTPFVVFAVTPFFDWVIGRDDTNIDAWASSAIGFCAFCH